MKSYVYSYTPKKLINITNKIKEVFPNSDNLQAQRVFDYKNTDIEALLKQIKNTKEDQLKYYSRSLKNHELFTLVYNLEKIDDDILNKVITILIYRNRERLLKVMWKNFCENCNNQFIINYFNRTTEQLDSMKFTEPPYKYINDIFRNTPSDWLANHFYYSDLSFFNNLQKFNIIQDTELAYQIGLNLFTIPNKKVFKKEEADTLCNIFSSYKIKTLTKIINNYLEIHEIREFDTILMTFFIDRLGKPTEKSNLVWQDIKSDAHQKARQWYIDREMQNFKDKFIGETEEAKRRYDFWMEYWEYIINLKYKETQNQLILVFDNIAVVEFGEINNAAYIYRRNFFDKKLRKYLSDKYTINHSGMKKKERITRIRHFGEWEPGARKKVNSFL